MKTLTAYIVSVCCVFALLAEAHSLGFPTQEWWAIPAAVLSASLYLIFRTALD